MRSRRARASQAQTQPQTHTRTLEPPADLTASALAREVPVLGRIARVDTKVLFNLDSGDMQPDDWLRIARAVHAALASGDDDYDGVVVVHGTDTMAYTASALAFLLGPLPRPVVLTGAQRPLAETRTDARQNLVDAALLATLDVPEVQIAFASRSLRGARTMKRDAWALDAFDSPSCPPLVELGLGVDVGAHVRRAHRLAPLDTSLERRVLAMRVFPGLDPEIVSAAVRSGIKGLVLEAYGTGNLPRLDGSLIPAIEAATEHDVPVLLVSQCPRGFVEMDRYAGGAAAARAGAISAGDMTREAAIAKLMVGLGRFGPGRRLRAWLERDVVGELTVR